MKNFHTRKIISDMKTTLSSVSMKVFSLVPNNLPLQNIDEVITIKDGF
jgi:hypothetical protein